MLQFFVVIGIFCFLAETYVSFLTVSVSTKSAFEVIATERSGVVREEEPGAEEEDDEEGDGDEEEDEEEEDDEEGEEEDGKEEDNEEGARDSLTVSVGAIVARDSASVAMNFSADFLSTPSFISFPKSSFADAPPATSMISIFFDVSASCSTISFCFFSSSFTTTLTFSTFSFISLCPSKETATLESAGNIRVTMPNWKETIYKMLMWYYLSMHI